MGFVFPILALDSVFAELMVFIYSRLFLWFFIKWYYYCSIFKNNRAAVLSAFLQ